MHTVTLDLASCSKQCTLLPQLPTELQAEVVDQVNHINMGAPYHDMSRACPVSHNIQKRKLFLERTTRHAMGCQEFSLLQASVITAYKAHNLCFICGGSRKSYDRQRVKEQHQCIIERTSTTTTTTTVFSDKGSIDINLQLTTLDKLISTAADQNTSLMHLLSLPSFATPRRTTTTTTLFGAILECDLPLITYQKHACFACQHLKTPSARSLEHYRLFKGHSPHTLQQSIIPPPPLPKTTTTTTTTTTTAASSSSSSLKYLPPIVFYPRAVIGGEETALMLQLIMEFGIDFQTAQPAKASPLITNYEDCLKLPHNNPPLTNYPIPTEQAATMARYKDLHTKLSTLLNQHQLSILMAD